MFSETTLVNHSTHDREDLMMQTNSFPRRGEGGYTAFELVIVIAIFGLVLFALGGLLNTGGASANFLAATATHQGRCRAMVEKVSRELMTARLVALADSPDEPRLDFQTPVDWDADGDQLDPDMLIEWGVDEEAGAVLGAFAVLSFVPYDRADEIADRIDYNDDGDQLDVFRVGRLVRRTAGGLRTAFGDLNLLVNDADPQGDVDGDGNPDPMFTFDGTQTVGIQIFALNTDVAGEPRFERFQTQLTLRNPQF